MTTAPARRHYPRFNHIAMSVPRELLEGDGPRELLDFYGDVFGWEEMPEMAEEGRVLVMKAHTFGQFVFLHADSRPTVAHPRDHYGFQVATAEEFDEVLARTQAWVAKGPDTEVVGPLDETYGPVRLRSFYVRHRLPLMVEIQLFDWGSVAA